jgi:predicted TPR repeat methyltransferase
MPAVGDWPVLPFQALRLHNAIFTSGDLVADRRAEYARALAESGDYAAAADLMSQALELASSWAAGWSLLGEWCDKAGDIPGAISAWRHLEALDSEGVFAAHLKLAAHGAGLAGEGTAVSYVEALFDQYAPQFETALVERLGYVVPDRLNALLREVMAENGIAMFSEALDLGCGTGLMGERIRAVTSYLSGIDLSAGMVALTAAKGVYDRVQKAELVAHLANDTEATALVCAADVLIYCGALPPILAVTAPALRPGGLFVFSLEAHDGEEPLFLRPSLRYAHQEAATRRALLDAGLEPLRFVRETLRTDRGKPVEGFLIVARKPDQTITPPAVPAVVDLPVPALQH